MKRIQSGVALVGALSILQLVSFGQSPAKTPDASATVKAFYAFHFRNKFDYSARGLKLRSRWLGANLHKLLLAELKRPPSPDQAPDLEGDPFTDSQEPPSSFRLGKPTQDGAKATVEVFFVWKDKGKVVQERRIEVDLARSADTWRIANIRADHADGDLVQWLTRNH